MKDLKAPISLFLCLAMCLTVFAQSVERTLVKSFNLKGNTSLVLDLEGDVDVQHWNNDLVRVQISIKVENVSDAILKSLIVAGRYNLNSTEGENGFVINAPSLEKEVKLRGQLLKEHLSYTIYAPESVSVQLSDISSTTLEIIEENSSSL
ncbi:MAG: Flp pilus assembly secretin CpaC [Polaribacter sp.]|jgi:Flp pilus assembly secretin CpaC